MLLQEESHKDLSKRLTVVEPIPFATDKWKSSHNNKTIINGKKSTYFSEHFKVPHHNINRCFKIHGYPSWNKNTSNKKYAAVIHHEDHAEHTANGYSLGLTNDQYTNLLSLLNKNNNVAPDPSLATGSANLACPLSLISHLTTTKWIIDSGSTDHICNDLSLFTNMKNISDDNHKITIPDDTQHQVTKKGNIELSNSILLKDVLYVPVFHFNHLSVYKICLDLGVNISFLINLFSPGSFNKNLFVSW